MSSISEPVETNVGKYRLIASLGHGGMADVYLAVVSGPAGFNKLQVVKRLRRGAADEHEQIEMFLDEARLAARLSHPNVVQTFEVHAADGEYFMAMEYLEGVPFNRVLAHCRRKAAPPGLLLQVLTDALAGIHYAHELTDYDGTPLRIVHRDASPHNIITTFDGQTKLLDFGIAKSGVRSNMTRAGILKGKIGYMAPEQALSRPLDRRADIFVLGITLWEIVTERRMWERVDEMGVLRLLGLGLIPDAKEARPDAPPELLRICARALAPDPNDRYPTAAEMRSDLLAYLHGAGLRVAAEDIGQFITAELGERRASIRKVIEQQLGKLKTASIPLPELGVLVESSSLPVIDSSPNSVRSDSSSSERNAPAPASTDPSRAAPRTVPPVAETLRPPAVVEIAPASQTTAPSISRPAPAAPAALEATGTAEPAGAAAPARGDSPSSGRQARIGAAIGLLVAAAAGTWFLLPRLGAGEGSGQAATTSAQPASSSAPAAESTAPSARPSPAGSTIELRIRVLPETAELYVDDARLPTNPFTGRFPADGAVHRLRAEASDHKSAAQVVVFDRDQTLDLTLETKAGGGRSWAAPATSPTASADDTAPTATTTEAPSGFGSAPKGKPKRQLGDDPFAAPAGSSTKTKRPLGEGI